MKYSVSISHCLLVLSFTGTALANKPAGTVQMISGIPYAKAGGQTLKLDIAMPSKGTGPFPALICIHGGGWVRGDRTQMSQTVRALAQAGYVTVSIDYRLAPKSRFPAPVEDCKAAVRWLRAKAQNYHIDKNNIGVLGFSAGAHLACMLGVTQKSDKLEGTSGYEGQSSEVQAVVSFFGPTDLTYQGFNQTVKNDNLIPLLGASFERAPNIYRRASPLLYVRKGAPPFLFFHGTNDAIVPLKQSQDMVKRLEAVGSPAKLITMDNQGHGWGGDKLIDSLKQMVLFFDKTLKKKQ